MHRRELIISAARSLDKARMIRFEERTQFMFATDVGRTASNFYIKYDTVEIINEQSKPIMTEGEILTLVSSSQEFDQIKVREDEMDELDRLTSDGCEMVVFGGKENSHGKVNILLQSYISRCSVDSFSLVSDMAYIAQVRTYLL
uniref:SEC63 domain-containing protein n=1 Tax=Biomphalaria glabrata TaxID=6526 RepID=A0A2C9L9T2_BIOGL